MKSFHDHVGLCNAALRHWRRAFRKPPGSPNRKALCDKASAQLDARRTALLRTRGCSPEQIEELLALQWRNGTDLNTDLWRDETHNEPPHDLHELDSHAIWRKLRKAQRV